MDSPEKAACPDRDLTVQEIFDAKDLLRERVPVPEWGGYVWIRSMGGAEYDTYTETLIKQDDDGKRSVTLSNSTARLVALATCTANGDRLFKGDAEMTMLGGKAVGVLKMLEARIRTLNRLDPKSKQDLAKNSEETPGDSSS